MNRLDLYMKYLRIEHDEQIFYVGYSGFEKEPDIDIKAIKNANKSLSIYDRYVNDLEKDLRYIENDINLLGSLSNISNEVSEIIEGFHAAEKSIDDLQNWGSNWKYIAMTLFKHILENHADELDNIGICQYNITENELKSIEGIDKFNL